MRHTIMLLMLSATLPAYITADPMNVNIQLIRTVYQKRLHSIPQTSELHSSNLNQVMQQIIVLET